MLEKKKQIKALFLRKIEKKRLFIWCYAIKTLLLHSQLSHGVMVALQILVLPAVVRVHLGQQRKSKLTRLAFSFYMLLVLKMSLHSS